MLDPLALFGRLLSVLNESEDQGDKNDADLFGSSSSSSSSSYSTQQDPMLSDQQEDIGCATGSAHFAVVIAAIGIPLLLLVAALILFCRHNPDDDSPTDNNEASDGATVSIEKDLEEGQDDYDDDNVGGRPQETNIQIDRTSTYLSFESSSSEGTTVQYCS